MTAALYVCLALFTYVVLSFPLGLFVGRFIQNGKGPQSKASCNESVALFEQANQQGNPCPRARVGDSLRHVADPSVRQHAK